MATDTVGELAKRGWPGYNAVWRWHFYAGVLCLPFLLWLPVTGAIYLFRPQIEMWLDEPYENLSVDGGRQTPEAQVLAALAAVPGGVLNSYELPATPRSAVRVLVGRGEELYRVCVHPETLAILNLTREDRRPMRVLFYLHGELLLGGAGSAAVELAASWAIVMILTGIYLWWPRNAHGLAGVLYPRLTRSGRVFWRDMHAVTGMWVSLFVLFLLVSGLPWAKFWGSTLQEVREVAARRVVHQDWTTGSASELATRAEMNTPVTSSDHAGHGHDASSGDLGGRATTYHAVNRLVDTVRPLELAPPVLISPPSKSSPQWTARSEAANRTRRTDIVLDGQSGAILERRDFAQWPLTDRLVGIGVAAHEGQLFGWFNQLLGALTAVGLVVLTVSSTVMWLRRRAPGTLGAPPAGLVQRRYSRLVFVLIVLLAAVLPLFGASAIAVLGLERWILRRSPRARKFLGLSHAAA